MAERFLDTHEVAERVGLSGRTIRRWVKARKFPAPFRWGKGWAWLESEVDRWMHRHAALNEVDPDSIPDEEFGRPSADNRGQTGTSLPEAKKRSSRKDEDG